MIKRRVAAEVTALLDQVPAVALLGPRQAGKTTLALTIAEGRPSVYLDLESAADRARRGAADQSRARLGAAMKGWLP